MHAHIGPFAIIQPCPPQLPIIEREAERLDQMQTRPEVGGQTHDVAGIGRNLRLIEDDFEHVRRLYIFS
jgi:hypothetical protein